MHSLQTPRLYLRSLQPEDASFILELLNSEGWLHNIGDRKLRNEEQAGAYIQKILHDPYTCYWVFEESKQKQTMGIVSFIKRAEQEFHDIGFAILPEYEGRGFAHEATQAVMEVIKKEGKHSAILGIALKSNLPSIRLLQKLGFQPLDEYEKEGEHFIHLKWVL
jgi:[ribosomal protein S5]-alanine N-acetyltransferase